MSVESERGGISERDVRRDMAMTGGDDLAKPMLRKLHAVLAATSDPRLSAIDHAVLAWLIEYADAKTGVCWPSMSTLAHVTRRSDRSMTRSVKKLLSRGYIEIVAPATPMSSIRYRVTFKDHAIIADRKKTARAHTLAARAHLGGAGQATVTGGDADVYTGVTPTSGGHDEGVQGVLTSEVGGPDTGGHSGVPPLSTNPYHHPEHEARDDEEGPSTPSPAAADGTAAPGGALPSAAIGGLTHERFWSVYPKRVDAARADAYLSELQSKGADYEVIIAGAAAYALHVKAKSCSDDRYVARPLNWLRDKRWLDDFTVRPLADRASIGKKTTAKGGTGTKDASRGIGEAATTKKSVKPAKPLESLEQRQARLDAARVKREAKAAVDALAAAERKVKDDAELEVARGNWIALTEMLGPLGGRVEDHLCDLYSRGRKIGTFQRVSNDHAARINLFISAACSDERQSGRQFRNVFGEAGEKFLALVEGYVVDRAAKQAQDAEAARARLAVVEAKAEAERERVDELRSELRKIRPTVLAGFTELGIEDRHPIGNALRWEADRLGLKFKQIDWDRNGSSVGAAFLNRPGDEVHFKSVFETLGAHDAELLLRICNAAVDERRRGHGEQHHQPTYIADDGSVRPAPTFERRTPTPSFRKPESVTPNFLKRDRPNAAGPDDVDAVPEQ